jgi:hypothetical protein
VDLYIYSNPAWLHGGNMDSFTKETPEALCWMIKLLTFREYIKVSKQNSFNEEIKNR